MKEKLKDRWIKWCYGGQTREFVRDHSDDIFRYNLRILKMFSIVALVVLVAGYFYAYKFGTDAERICFCIFVAFYGFLSIYLYYTKNPPKRIIQILVIMAIFAISFAAMIYELQETEVISVFVPVCFILTGLVFFMPMHSILAIDVLLLAVFIPLSLIFERAHTVVDVFDCMLCTVFGLVIGHEVLKSRLGEISSFSNELRLAKSETALYDKVVNSIAKQYTSIFYLRLDMDEMKTVYVDGEVDKKYGGFKEETNFNQAKIRYAETAIVPEDRSKYYKFCERNYIREQLADAPSFAFTYNMIGPEGPEICKVLFISLKEYGDPDGVIVAYSNINKAYMADMKAKQLILEAKKEARAAGMDSLTGVSGRSGFDKLKDQLNKNIIEGKPKDFAIIVCDLNFLKEMNDKFGHDAGDKLIIECAKAIDSVVPKSSIFRIGGDEFAVVLTGKSFDSADEYFEKLRALAAKGDPSFACGMAKFDDKVANGFTDVFNMADAEMYANKKEMHSMRIV